MRSNAVDDNVWESEEFWENICCGVGKKASSAHSGIEGEVSRHSAILFSREGGKVFCFFYAGEAGGPSLGDDFFAFFGEGGTEEVDGGLDASGAKTAGFADIGDAEVGDFFGLEEGGEGFKAVAVGTGFHHSHDFLTAFLAGEGEIVTQGGKVDFGPSAWG